jgi:hypothetical protein
MNNEKYFVSGLLSQLVFWVFLVKTTGLTTILSRTKPNRIDAINHELFLANEPPLYSSSATFPPVSSSFYF